ncbi:PAS domain-containing protein [Sediminibacterium sp. WSJ-3]|nr:PAS domain-containing protein [Sediminibacterium soli]
MLGEHLQVGRALYVEVEGEGPDTVAAIVRQYVRDLPPVPDKVPYVAFCDGFIGELYRTDQTVVVTDSETDPRFDEAVRASWRTIRVRASVSLALNKQGREQVIFGLHNEGPRQWTEDEIRLVREVAERTWADAERARAENALRQREIKYRTLFETMGQSYSMVKMIRDESGKAVDARMLELNPAFERLMGIPVSEAINRTLLEVFPQIEDSWIQVYEQVITQNTPQRIEHRFAAMDKWFQVYAYPVADDQLLLLSENITERKKADEALQASEIELKRLLKLRDDFIGVASHELKTPVTSMKVYGEIVKEKMELIGTPQDADMVSKLNGQIDRLIHLINTLLDTTRIAEGQLRLALESLDLCELVEDRVNELRPTTGHRFTIQAEQPLPRLPADRERIGQVLTNLLSNAIKYSPKTSEIVVTCTRREHTAEISVSDQGLGIPESDQSKIFDRFYRVISENRSTYPGMGLGLYIASQIITRHHGKLWLRSAPGKGSTFIFSLPYSTPRP